MWLAGGGLSDRTGHEGGTVSWAPRGHLGAADRRTVLSPSFERVGGGRVRGPRGTESVGGVTERGQPEANPRAGAAGSRRGSHPPRPAQAGAQSLEAVRGGSPPGKGAGLGGWTDAASTHPLG